MTNKIEFTESAQKEIKHILGLLFKAEDVQALNIISLLTIKLKPMIKYLTEQ